MKNVFNNAIEAHTKWKITLDNHIEKGIIENTKDVGNCHICELGQWIYGEGAKYNQLPSFELMCSTHEQFHRVAAEVVFYSNTNNKGKARSLMTASGAFSQSSAKLIKALMDCSKEIIDSAVNGIRNRRKVQDVLKAKENNKVFSVEGNRLVSDAIRIMVNNNIGSLAVQSNDEHLGVFTERGCFQHIANRGSMILGMPISEVLDINTIYVDPHDSIEQCMILMTSTHTRHLPVMDNGKLVGMISIGDVIKQVISDDEDKISQLDAYVHNSYGSQS